MSLRVKIPKILMVALKTVVAKRCNKLLKFGLCFVRGYITQCESSCYSFLLYE